MTLITITLTEEEQKHLLKMEEYARSVIASDDTSAPSWLSIAEKVRRVQKAEAAFREAYEQPETTECGLCGIPKDIHPDLTADHHWQWLRKLPPAEPPVRDDKWTGDSGGQAYWGNYPGEPAE